VKRQRYSNDFKDRALTLVGLGRPVPEVAAELGTRLPLEAFLLGVAFTCAAAGFRFSSLPRRADGLDVLDGDMVRGLFSCFLLLLQCEVNVDQPVTGELTAVPEPRKVYKTRINSAAGRGSKVSHL